MIGTRRYTSFRQSDSELDVRSFRRTVSAEKIINLCVLNEGSLQLLTSSTCRNFVQLWDQRSKRH